MKSEKDKEWEVQEETEDWKDIFEKLNVSKNNTEIIPDLRQTNPDPKCDNLVLENMAPTTENSQSVMNEMKKNY